MASTSSSRDIEVANLDQVVGRVVAQEGLRLAKIIREGSGNHERLTAKSLTALIFTANHLSYPDQSTPVARIYCFPESIWTYAARHGVLTLSEDTALTRGEWMSHYVSSKKEPISLLCHYLVQQLVTSWYPNTKGCAIKEYPRNLYSVYRAAESVLKEFGDKEAPKCRLEDVQKLKQIMIDRMNKALERAWSSLKNMTIADFLQFTNGTNHPVAQLWKTSHAVNETLGDTVGEIAADIGSRRLIQHLNPTQYDSSISESLIKKIREVTHAVGILQLQSARRNKLAKLASTKNETDGKEHQKLDRKSTFVFWPTSVLIHQTSHAALVTYDHPDDFLGSPLQREQDLELWMKLSGLKETQRLQNLLALHCAISNCGVLDGIAFLNLMMTTWRRPIRGSALLFRTGSKVWDLSVLGKFTNAVDSIVSSECNGFVSGVSTDSYAILEEIRDQFSQVLPAAYLSSLEEMITSLENKKQLPISDLLKEAWVYSPARLGLSDVTLFGGYDMKKFKSWAAVYAHFVSLFPSAAMRAKTFDPKAITAYLDEPDKQ